MDDDDLNFDLDGFFESDLSASEYFGASEDSSEKQINLPDDYSVNDFFDSDIPAAEFYADERFNKPPVAEEDEEDGEIIGAMKRAKDALLVDFAGKGSVGLGQGLVGMAEFLEATGSIPWRTGAFIAERALNKDFDLPEYRSYIKEAMDYIGYDPEQTNEWLSTFYSDERKAEEAEYEQAKEFWDSAGVLLSEPNLIIGRAAETLPHMMGIMGVSRLGASKVLSSSEATALAAGKTAEEAAIIAKAAADKAARWLASITEGAMQTGMSFDDYLEDGIEFGKAYTTSLLSGATTGLIARAGGALGEKFGMGDVEAGIGGKAGNIFTKFIFGGAQEGILEEAPQSATEQMWDNFARGKPILEGVGKATATGGLTGFAAGGGMAMFQSGPTPEQTAERIASAETIEEALAAAEEGAGSVTEPSELQSALNNYVNRDEEGEVQPEAATEETAAGVEPEGEMPEMVGPDYPGSVLVPEEIQEQMKASAVEMPDLETELAAMRLERQAELTQEPEEIEALQSQANELRKGAPSLFNDEQRERAGRILDIEDTANIAAEQEANAIPESEYRKGKDQEEADRLVGLAKNIRSEHRGLSARIEKQKLLDEINAIQKPSNYDNIKLQRQDYRNALQGMANDLVKGGGISIIPREGAKPTSNTGDIIYDYGAENVIRTKSLNPEWFQNQGWTVSDVRKSVAKALNGYKLGSRQKQIVDAMLTHIEDVRSSPENVEAAKQERDEKRAERKGYPPISAYTGAAYEGVRDKYMDARYTPDIPSIDELAQDARDLGIEEDAVVSIMESQQDDKTVSERLYNEILDVLRAQEAEGTTGPTGGTGDMFGVDTTQESRILEEKAKEEAKQKDVEAAEKAEQAKGLSDGPLFEAAEQTDIEEHTSPKQVKVQEDGSLEIEKHTSPKQVTVFEDIPEGMEVTLPEQDIESGKTTETTVNAGQIYQTVKDKIAAYRDLYVCLL